MTVRLVYFIGLLLAVVLCQPTITDSWTQVNVQRGTIQSALHPYSVAPRAAVFSDGRYIIVYSINNTFSNAVSVGQIFYANGSVAKSEFELSGLATLDLTALYTSPNVVIFNDDTFLVVFCKNQVSILARRFSSDGTPAGDAYAVEDTQKYPVSTYQQKGIELVGYADKSYTVLYFSASASCAVSVSRNSADALLLSYCMFSTTSAAGASIRADRSRSVSYLAIEDSTDLYLSFGKVTSDTAPSMFWQQYFSTPAQDPNLSLASDSSGAVLFTKDDSIYYALFTDRSKVLSPLYIVQDNSSAYLDPIITYLNDTSLLMAYSLRVGTTKLLIFQSAMLQQVVDDITLLAPLQVQFNFTKDLTDFQFVPMLGGDLLVVGKESASGAIQRLVLTFCGNNQLELNEQCDGGPNCNANCRCSNGLTPFQGVCGLPNVEPVLDCVEPSGNSYKLHFSFNNQDGVQQTIQHGYQNYFSPSDLATDRPQTFAVGATLTYPASPYSMIIPQTLTELNWVLGSYNLTVDLTNITALLCPASVGFVVNVRSKGIIASGKTFANNFASKYNVSLTRLTTDVVQTVGAGEPNLGYNYFDLTVTVAPSPVNTSQQTSAQSVAAAIEDYKLNSTSASQDLLQGYDASTSIKEITPTPTGVEVRGNRYDSSNVIPPTAAPIATLVPTNLFVPYSEPVSVSSTSTMMVPFFVLVLTSLSFNL